MRWLTRWPVIALSIGLIAAYGYHAHWFERLGLLATDLEARVLLHRVDSDLLVVGIDEKSLKQLRTFPWPRRVHAQMLDQLRALGPKRVFVDIDFSSPSNPADDDALAKAIARWSPETLVLPAFMQPAQDDPSVLMGSLPLAELAKHVTLANVRVLQGIDGLTRRVPDTERIGGEEVSSVAAALAGIPIDAQSEHAIDYSIDAASVPRISYVDLLEGRVPASAVTGKTVLIGAAAIELNDIESVPVAKSLPGVMILALSTETLRHGALHPLSAQWTFSLLAAWVALLAFLFRWKGWRVQLIVLFAALVSSAVAVVYAYGHARLLIDWVPFAITAGALFLAALVKSLDQQTLRALALAVGIRRRDALLASIVESTPDSIVCVDNQGKIQTANAAAAALFGSSRLELLDADIATFLPQLRSSGPSESLQALVGTVVEQEAIAADGRPFPVELALSRVDYRDEYLYTAIVRDITQRKAQQRLLEHQARHDPLTGLPNRLALTEFLQAQLLASQEPAPFALLVLDLCRFKEVNDTLGHDVGDQVLCEIADRFARLADPVGLLARVGGDEFTMIVRGPNVIARVEKLAADLTAVLRVPIDVSGVSLDLGVSIGIALFPDHARDEQALLKHADIAMYSAKRRGGTHEYYDPASDGHTVRRLTMMTELRGALEAEALELHYQPQVTVSNGRIESAEALLRWEHPRLGRVPPMEFIPLVETTDLVQPLTMWTLKEALRRIAEWRASGLDLRIAVNVSARLLQDVRLPAHLESLLAASQVPGNRLEIEITESAMLLDPARALKVLSDVRELGVTISVDDYGTGYSSLSYLRDLPIHALKMDKSFVLQMRERAGDQAIVASTAQLAHALGLEVIAEGVETEWHVRHLAAAGYDVLQGFAYSAALPAAHFFSWTAEFNERAHATRKRA